MQNRDFWVENAFSETFPAVTVRLGEESVERAIRPNGTAIRPVQSTNRPIDIAIRPNGSSCLFLKTYPTVGRSTDREGYSADPSGRSTDRAFCNPTDRRDRSTDR